MQNAKSSKKSDQNHLLAGLDEDREFKLADCLAAGGRISEQKSHQEVRKFTMKNLNRSKIPKYIQLFSFDEN